MISDPKLFYDFYLKDYHGIKARYLKHLLDNNLEHEKAIFKSEVDTELKDAFRLTIKSDLRQTYFHSIETFFEIFFALNPKGKEKFDDEYLMFNLTNSKWQDNYRKIKETAEKENQLDFLDEEIEFTGKKVTIGNYIFYMGLFNNEKHPDLSGQINDSVEAIKYGVKIIANDFVNREEYNAYKHGLRIIPVLKKFMLADYETLEIKYELDLSDSMTFYYPTNDPNELTTVTKLFDTERDSQMTFFCSNLINHMIFYRKIAMNKERTKDKGKEQLAVTFFGKEPIEKCNKINVTIQDLVHTIRRTGL